MAREGIGTEEQFSANVVKATPAPATPRTIKILPVRGEPIVVTLPAGTVVIVDGKTI